MNVKFFEISRPFHFITINHASRNFVIIYIPLALCALTFLPFITIADEVPQIFNSGGLIDRLYPMLSILPGFYLAALAAVASFNSEKLDKLMPSPTPTIACLYKHRLILMDLTWRRFLSLLFSYLTAVSLAFFLVSVASDTISPYVKNTLKSAPYEAIIYTQILFLFSYVFVLYHMFCITLFGLFNIGDYMHQKEDEHEA